MLVLDRMLEELLPELAELTEHPVEAGIADRVLLLWRRGDRRKSHFPEAELLGEMAIDARHIDRFGRQGHAGANGTRPMPSQQLLDLGRHDVVAAGTVVEHAKL